MNLSRKLSTKTAVEFSTKSFLDTSIVVAGDVWRVVGVGAQRDGNTFCHLASTTRFRQQKNGKNPIQIGDWVDTAVLIAATNQGA